MPVVNLDNLVPEARGLCLYRHDRNDNLISNELIMFDGGAPAINTVLRRAAISGRVVIEPFDDPIDYFADVYVDESTWVQTILLDAKSYKILKYKWMRCKVESYGTD